MNALDPPRDPRANLEWRDALLGGCTRDAELRALVRERFRRDLLFAFNALFWTFDPRRPPFHLPFLTYPFQEDHLAWLEERHRLREDGLTEKSRDMGVSWMVLLFGEHKWLTAPGFQMLVGSRKEELVDRRGDLNTLFEKLRYNLERLPAWLLPKGFRWEVHSKHMLLENPETGAAIVGESTNPAFSRQGRYSVILLDEFAHVEEGETIWRATADSSPCRLAVSTPNGLGNQFARLRNSGIRVATLHWSLHPLKAEGLYCEWPRQEEEGVRLRSEWYDRECARRSPDEVAQELDIDYFQSGRPVFDPGAVALLERGAPEPLARGYLLVDDGAERVTFHPAPAGNLWVWEYPQAGEEYVIGADPAEGLAHGDRTSVDVLKSSSGEQVASFKGHFPPDECGDLCWKLALWYNRARVAIEANNHGLTANVQLYKIRRYRRIHFHERLDVASPGSTDRMGWLTTANTKALMVDDLAREVREGVPGIRDRRTVEELRTFVHLGNGKMGASPGHRDDAVISRAIAGQMRKLYPAGPPEPLPKPKPFLHGKADPLDQNGPDPWYGEEPGLSPVGIPLGDGRSEELSQVGLPPWRE